MLVPPPVVVQVPPPRRSARAPLVVLVVLAILVAALAGMLVAREMSAPAGVALEPVATVVLRSDTYVTNHGWNAGHVTAWPAVLQAGTAVLVDRHGNPVTR